MTGIYYHIALVWTKFRSKKNRNSHGDAEDTERDTETRGGEMREGKKT
jgi:hypothetical protein